MRTMHASAEHAGDPGHPDHEVFLLELGRATYAAACLAGIAFDVLRVHSGFDSAALYSDPLGKLENRLRAARPALEGVDEFIDLLGSARAVRNDLIHALPVKHGLHRRLTKNLRYVKSFYTVESLQEARELFERTNCLGNAILYSDGGEAVRRWYAQSTDD